MILKPVTDKVLQTPFRSLPTEGKSASEVMSFGTKQSRMVRGRTFWARGYRVSTVGLDEQTIREYIRNQEKMDMLQEELAL